MVGVEGLVNMPQNMDGHVVITEALSFSSQIPATKVIGLNRTGYLEPTGK